MMILAYLVRYGFDVSFLLVCLASMLSFFGQKGWSFDLLANFRLVFIAALLGYAVVYLLRGTWRQSLVCLLLVGFQASQCVFYYPGLAMVNTIKASTGLTAMQLNVWELNTQPQKVLATVEAEKADVLALEEYTPQQYNALHAGLVKQFPYAIVRLDESIALYSRYPFTKQTVLWTQHDHVLSDPNVECAIVAGIQVASKPVDVVVMHTLSPTDGHRYHHQQAHMQMLEQHPDAFGPTMLLMGDLNATPWAWTFKRLLRQLNLTDSEEGTGIWPTWPEKLPVLPLDHILYRGHLRLIERQVLPSVGSDHLPVVARFSVS